MQPGLVYHFGTADAAQVFTGECTRYSKRDATSEYMIQNMLGANRAMSLHSLMGEIEFEAQVTSGSTDFWDLSGGPAITYTGAPAGILLARSATEHWGLLREKTAAISSALFPDGTLSGGDTGAATLSAFTPDQSGSTIALPGDDVIYSTIGMTQASGEIQDMTISQMWTIRPGKASPDGKLRRPRATGYLRRLTLMILATGARPAPKTPLTITGAPAHGADYKIVSSSEAMPFLDDMVYTINAVWIPPFTA